MNRTDFRFLERLRVRWAEVDAHKIVFNGHYFMYVNTALAGYWRALALPYEQSLDHLGGDMFVRRAALDYERPARYADILDVGVRCARVGNSSLVLSAAVFRQAESLATGEIVYVFTDRQGRGAKPVPQNLREALQAFEAGVPMVEVKTGRWDEIGLDAQAIRTAVFVEEQQIPADMEWDEVDSSCVHAVAYNRLGMPLATGRLLEHVPGVAKIGRMAVLQTMRGSGVGRSVLDALMAAARVRGDHEVVLHAQLSAAAFYARAGFDERGPVFEEAGIRHIEMTCSL